MQDWSVPSSKTCTMCALLRENALYIWGFSMREHFLCQFWGSIPYHRSKPGHAWEVFGQALDILLVLQANVFLRLVTVLVPFNWWFGELLWEKLILVLACNNSVGGFPLQLWCYAKQFSPLFKDAFFHRTAILVAAHLSVCQSSRGLLYSNWLDESYSPSV